MQYALMNKNRKVGAFEIEKTDFGDKYTFEKNGEAPLPIGFDFIDGWLNDRKASKHNSHLRKIMTECGCEKTEGFIKITHAASINDTYWVKSESEDVSWEQISFYRNPFNEVISKLAFEGMGLYGIKMTETAPELSTDGSFRKCWVREPDGEIYLYKRGSDGARNTGLEPYCEAMASEIAVRLLGKDAIPYQLVHLHGELASKCKLFSNEQYGYTPLSRCSVNHASPQALMQFYANIGSEEQFRRMIVLDALTFNVDRHAGNHGILTDNETQTPICMAPVFDLNMALLPHIEREDWKHIGNTMLNYGPRIGEDFTRIGQQAMTSSIRATLIGLKGFQFSFRGNEEFEPERVKFIETLLNRQLEALLSRDVLYTKDVFVPERTQDSITEEQQKETETEQQTDAMMQKLWQEHELCKKFSEYLEEEGTNGEPVMVLYGKENPREEVHLDLSTGKATLFVDMEPIGAFEALNYPKLLDAANAAEIAYSEENGLEIQQEEEMER